jgi:hypothetical protein
MRTSGFDPADTVKIADSFLKYCLTGFTKMCRLQMVIDKGYRGISELVSEMKE